MINKTGFEDHERGYFGENRKSAPLPNKKKKENSAMPKNYQVPVRESPKDKKTKK